MEPDQMSLWAQIVEFFSMLFGTESWPPRWHCGRWTGFHGWLYIISDLAIWASYLVIPYFLIRFLTQKRGIPMPKILWFFAGFIMLCGFTHAMDALMFWWPAYRLSALIRFSTAIFSWATVLALFRFFPMIMGLKTGKEFNIELEERKKTEVELKQSNAILEQEIEERKKITEELIKAKKISEEASVAKEQFMANMSHEIRTPMNAIIGFTNLIEKKNLGEKENQYINYIKSSGENLLVLINDILDYSKIQAGMMLIEKVPFGILDLLQSIEIMFSTKAHEKKLKLKFNIDKNISALLIGDPTRLTQILINLIGNALKFTEKGIITVDLKLKSIENNFAKICISVKDTGVGIPTDKQAKIFERFVQASAETTRSYGGSGLGLAIVKSLVEMQDGEISLNSIEAEGTEFVVVIPYQIKEESETDSVETKSIPETSELKRFEKNLQVLLVEDNIMNQLLAKEILSRYGCTVDIAENGGVAIEMAKNKEYDIILMDIQMPIMDGYNASKKIRNELHLTTPIIAMTAHIMPGEREKCIRFGMNDYISKPFKIRDLHNMISKYTTAA